MGYHVLLQGIFPTPWIEPVSPVSPALQAGSLPVEPSGKLTGVGSHGEF